MQLIEKVGTGLKRILAFANSRNINVEFDIDSFFTIVFFRPGFPKVQKDDTVQAPDKYRTNTGQVSDKHCEILKFSLSPKSLKEIMTHMNLKHRESFIKNYLKPLLDEELLSYTIPENPRHRHQKYVTTEKGRQFTI
jgi:ATP-dependent DNA helicase RecG